VSVRWSQMIMCAFVACVIALAGCVTERVEPARPRPTTASSGESRGGGDGSTSKAPDSSPVLDRLATPAIKADSVLTRVVVAVKPIGSIPYDGMVLPLISPDGRFAATQVGPPPPWPALLAEPGAHPEGVHTRIEIYDLMSETPTLVVVPEPLPEGCLLGRGVSDRGFLIERPNEDGSRWIGLVTWTGALDWLIGGTGDEADERVNAQATLLPTGDLVYVRDGVLRMRGVSQASAGEESVLRKPGVRFVLPMATGDEGVVYALAEVGGGADADGRAKPGVLELFAITVRESTLGAGRVLGMDFARRVLASEFRMLDAYQAAGAAAPALPTRRQSNIGADIGTGSAGSREPGVVRLNIQEPLAIFGSVGPRVRLFDPSTGQLRAMPPGSYAAARWREAGADGWLISVAGQDGGGQGDPGIVFEPSDRGSRGEPSDMERSASPRVVAGSMVPRATLNPERPVIVLGALAGDPTRVAVTLMKSAETE
jgi:hypothetical protein